MPYMRGEKCAFFKEIMKRRQIVEMQSQIKIMELAVSLKYTLTHISKWSTVEMTASFNNFTCCLSANRRFISIQEKNSVHFIFKENFREMKRIPNEITCCPGHIVCQCLRFRFLIVTIDATMRVSVSKFIFWSVFPFSSNILSSVWNNVEWICKNNWIKKKKSKTSTQNRDNCYGVVLKIWESFNS